MIMNMKMKRMSVLCAVAVAAMGAWADGARFLASGMYNKDLTKKPSYWAIDRLVNHEWKTKTRVVVDRDGMVRFRGFKGKYEVHYVE